MSQQSDPESLRVFSGVVKVVASENKLPLGTLCVCVCVCVCVGCIFMP